MPAFDSLTKILNALQTKPLLLLAVYSRIPWVYGRIHKVYGRIPRPWHWVGERYACYTCKRNVPGSNPTALKHAKTCVGH